MSEFKHLEGYDAPQNPNALSNAKFVKVANAGDLAICTEGDLTLQLGDEIVWNWVESFKTFYTISRIFKKNDETYLETEELDQMDPMYDVVDGLYVEYGEERRNFRLRTLVQQGLRIFNK